MCCERKQRKRWLQGFSLPEHREKSCQGHSEEDCEKRKFGDEGRDFVSGCAKFEISSRPPKETNELAVYIYKLRTLECSLG